MKCWGILYLALMASACRSTRSATLVSHSGDSSRVSSDREIRSSGSSQSVLVSQSDTTFVTLERRDTLGPPDTVRVETVKWRVREIEVRSVDTLVIERVDTITQVSEDVSIEKVKEDANPRLRNLILLPWILFALAICWITIAKGRR